MFTATPAAPAAVVAPAANARPEWLPEDLWDAEKGAKVDDVAALIADAKAAREAKAALPKAASDYKAVLPEGTRLPDGIRIDAESRDFKGVQELALREGFSQKQVSAVLEYEANRVAANNKIMSDAIAARDAALGPNGPARVDTLRGQMASVFDEATTSDMMRMLVTNRNVVGFEKLFAAIGSQGIDTLSRAGRVGEAPGKIAGYENMTMRQRLAAAGHN